MLLCCFRLDRKRVTLDDSDLPSTVDWCLMRHKTDDFGKRPYPTGWTISAIKAVEAQIMKTTG